MTDPAEQLEKPFPKPSESPAGYARARALEALLEGFIALRFLEEGYTRNAAGKAFQAWKALLGALLALEKERVKAMFRSDKEKEWLERRAISRVPTSRLKLLSQLLEDLGYRDLSAYTDKALDLHEYQYHGPDPDAEVSKYRSRREAAKDVLLLLQKLADLVKAELKPKLERVGLWTEDHEEGLKQLKQALNSLEAHL